MSMYNDPKQCTTQCIVAVWSCAKCVHTALCRGHCTLCHTLWCPVVRALRYVALVLRATLKSISTGCSLSRHRANTPLSQQRGLCRDPSRSVPAPSLSRRSLSCRDARPTTLYRDREVPVATQTSLLSWEPCRDIRFLSRHNCPRHTE